MTTTTLRPLANRDLKRLFKPVIKVFHCFNALPDNISTTEKCEIESVAMPCSSMTREVFLLKAFEAGADAVIVLVCPEGACDYLEGNIRARKRVDRVKKILDEIGIGGQRLNIYNVPRGDLTATEHIVKREIASLIS
jgi:F420-non-reducing hydrogenase iron-sulfur subunit